MKKLLTAAGILAVLSVVPAAGFAADMKIGYLSLPRIFEGYKKYNDAEQKIADRKKPLRDMAAELQELQKRDVSSLSEQGKQEVLTQINTKRQTMETQADEIAKDADRMMREILQDVETISNELRVKEKFSYIVDERLIISGPEDMDLTGKVIAILNERYQGK